MRTVVAVLAIAFLALAGCSSKSTPDTYTCLKTGRVIDLSTVAGSSAKGFDPETACPAPIPPSVHLTKLPATISAYVPTPVAWEVRLGNYTSGGGHTMLTQLMWSHHPISDDKLKEPATYGTNAPLVMYAHQELDPPATPFTGKVTLPLTGMTLPGSYYVRAYALVRANGLTDTDFWSPETKITIAPANATGVVKTVTIGQGVLGAVGKLDTPTLSIQLGDAVKIHNGDVLDHTFKMDHCGQPAQDIVVAAGKDSTPTVYTVPGSCVYKSDNPDGAQTLTLNVQQPA
jgi:hypothetical protein